MSWRWAGFTAVLAATLLSYGIFLGRDRLDQNAVETPPRLGYYFRNAVITETTAAGAPRIRLAARNIEQNPSDDSVSLEQVNVDYLAIPDRPWNLQAAAGQLPTGSSALTFSGNVTLQPGVAADVAVEPVRPVTDGGKSVKKNGAAMRAVMHTDSLTIDSRKNVATTDAAVAIDVGTGDGRLNRVTARGLYADLNSAKIKLNSAVHGRFVANGASMNSAAGVSE